MCLSMVGESVRWPALLTTPYELHSGDSAQTESPPNIYICEQLTTRDRRLSEQTLGQIDGKSGHSVCALFADN